jgi:hypothetical protein
MKTSARLASLTLLAAAAAALGGCKNGDLTPELSGLSNRPADTTNHYEVTNNVNMRGFSDDFNRAWMLDNPVGLSPYPVIRTSGNPR